MKVSLYYVMFVASWWR